MENKYSKKYKNIIVEIVKIENNGICAFGHKVGEKFVFDEYGPDKKLCSYAVATLMPAITTLLHGGKFAWNKEGDELLWGCPHPGSTHKGMGQVIFKLIAKDKN